MKGQDLGYTGVTLGQGTRFGIHRGYFGSGDRICDTPGLIWVSGEDLGNTRFHLGEGTGFGIPWGYFG